MHAMQILEIAVHGEQLFIADDALQASYQQFVRIALTAKKPVYSSEVCQELKTMFASSLLPIVVAYEGDLFGYSYDAVQMQRILRNLIVILFHVPVEESWEPYQTLCELVNRGSPVCYSSHYHPLENVLPCSCCTYRFPQIPCDRVLEKLRRWERCPSLTNSRVLASFCCRRRHLRSRSGQGSHHSRYLPEQRS